MDQIETNSLCDGDQAGPAGNVLEDEEFKKYVLAQTRAGILHLKLQINDLMSVGVALKSGTITTEAAIAELHRAGLLFHVAEA